MDDLSLLLFRRGDYMEGWLLLLFFRRLLFAPLNILIVIHLEPLCVRERPLISGVVKDSRPVLRMNVLHLVLIVLLLLQMIRLLLFLRWGL